MRAALMLSLILLALVSSVPVFGAKPDVSVGLEVQSPADKVKFLPGERIEVVVQITDPLQLVRHVLVRVATPSNHLINGDQDASPPIGGRPTPGQPEMWKKIIELPSSAVNGRYLLQIEATGDGNTPLQWKLMSFEVASAGFALKIISPSEGTVLSRNDNFDVTALLDDPRRKARRVFILLEDAQRKQILNGDREADRKGNLWIRNIHVPATAVPGTYQITVVVYGEGRELLASQRRPVSISVAPVRLGDVVLEPPSGFQPGQAIQASALVTDPRNIVRQVLVTVDGPNGRSVVRSAPARRNGENASFEVHLDEDAVVGTYTIEFTAVAQANEVVATRRLTFSVRNNR